MKRLLLVGGSGLLGREVAAAALLAGWDVLAPSSTEFNLCQPDHIGQLPAGDLGKLDAVVNCAAYTQVDQAEQEPVKAFELNVLGPSFLAAACAMEGLPLIHVSTDYVFDGESERSYLPTDLPHPLGVYGETKLKGEECVLQSGARALILRTSWLFGPARRCFPESIVRRWLEGGELRVVGDQFGCPTYTPDLAHWMVELCSTKFEPGIQHAAGPEVWTWHGLAEAAVQAYAAEFGGDRSTQIASIRTEDWPTAARRPRRSALDSSELAARLGPMRPIREALTDWVRRVKW